MYAEDFSVKWKSSSKGEYTALVDAFVEGAKENGHDIEAVLKKSL